MANAQDYIEESRRQTIAALEHLKPPFFTEWAIKFNKPNLEYIINQYDFSIGPLPTLPDFVSNASYDKFSYAAHTDHVWSASEMAEVEAAILATLANGGIGISEELQDSLFRSDRERKLLALSDALDKVNAATSARGYRIPNNILTSARNEVILKYQYDLENQSREITKLMEEHARTNWQFAVEKGIDAETFHANFTSRFDEIFVKLTEAAINKYKLEVEAELQIFRAKVENITARLNIDNLRVQASATAMNAQLSKAKLELDAETASIAATLDAIAKNATSEVNRYSDYTKLASYSAQTAAASDSNIKVTSVKGTT